MHVQEAAEVDVGHHTKLSEQAADAAYSPFERQLAQLEALSQVAPLCMAHFPNLYRCAIWPSVAVVVVFKYRHVGLGGGYAQDGDMSALMHS